MTCQQSVRSDVSIQKFVQKRSSYLFAKFLNCSFIQQIFIKGLLGSKHWHISCKNMTKSSILMKLSFKCESDHGCENVTCNVT